MFLLISILSCFCTISLCTYLSLCLYSRISRVRKRKLFLLSRILFLLMNDTCDFKSCVALHVRIANHLVEDSCCRGGIVNTRFGRSCALLVRPESPTALWRFRVSTANSLSGRSRLHFDTHIRYIDQIYARQDIRVCGDDHFEPPKRQ